MLCRELGFWCAWETTQFFRFVVLHTAVVHSFVLNNTSLCKYAIFYLCILLFIYVIWISIINNATMNILIHALYQVHYAFLFGLNLVINFLGSRIDTCSWLADHAKLFSFQLCVSPSWSIFSHFNLTNKQQQQQQITVRGLAQRKRTLIRSLEYDLTWTFFFLLTPSVPSECYGCLLHIFCPYLKYPNFHLVSEVHMSLGMMISSLILVVWYIVTPK